MSKQLNGHKAQFLEPAKLYLIPMEQLAQEWPLLQNQLLSAPELWNTQYTLDELRARLEASKSQLWVAKVGDERLFWGLTDVLIRANDGRRILQVWWMRGERFAENMVTIVEVFQQLAAAQGFHSIEVQGRKGWERILAPHGFRLRRVELVRELETQK